MDNVKLVIKKAQNQDQKAFNDLFSSHWGYLYNFQLKKTGNTDLAEEITIITFARAFDRISTFNDQFEFKTWLLSISKNIYNDLLRKENKKITLKNLSCTNDLQEFSTDDHPSPCLLYTSPSPRDATLSRMPSSA